MNRGDEGRWMYVFIETLKMLKLEKRKSSPVEIVKKC